MLAVRTVILSSLVLLASPAGAREGTGPDTATTPASPVAQPAAAVSPGAPPSASNEPRKFNFNLSSTTACVLAGHHHDFHFADIQVDGKRKTVVPTDLLTPGEYVALHQMLTTGQQTVILGAGGKATGGRFKVDPALSRAIKELAANARSQQLDRDTASLGQVKGSVVADSALMDDDYISEDGSSGIVSGAAVVIGNKRTPPARPAPAPARKRKKK